MEYYPKEEIRLRKSVMRLPYSDVYHSIYKKQYMPDDFYSGCGLLFGEDEIVVTRTPPKGCCPCKRCFPEEKK